MEPQAHERERVTAGRWLIVGAIGLLGAYATAVSIYFISGAYSIISDGHNTLGRLLANPISVRLPLLVPNSGEWYPPWLPGPLVFEALPKVSVGTQTAFWVVIAGVAWAWMVVSVRSLRPAASS
jgi:hypothetical protein